MTYGDYLKIPELLTLQDRKSEGPEHDEMLFIIIHQVYELWFKQVLHELDQLISYIGENAIARGEHQLIRILKILKTMVSQLDILETMTPLEFLSFRTFLGASSGFESWQFREMEFVLGHKQRLHVERFAEASPERAALEERYAAPSLWAHFLAMLDRAGHPIPSDALDRPATEPTAPSPGVQAALIDVYRTDPALTGFCELLTDLDEGLQEWRYRHVMMVQRTIGTKHGTGGSAGAEYLRTTLFHPVFPDLWEIRSAL
jgi:tryptophan 2,3-dioxygenase